MEAGDGSTGYGDEEGRNNREFLGIELEIVQGRQFRHGICAGKDDEKQSGGHGDERDTEYRIELPYHLVDREHCSYDIIYKDNPYPGILADRGNH